MALTVQLLFPFHRCGNRGSEKESHRQSVASFSSPSVRQHGHVGEQRGPKQTRRRMGVREVCQRVRKGRGPNRRACWPEGWLLHPETGIPAGSLRHQHIQIRVGPGRRAGGNSGRFPPESTLSHSIKCLRGQSLSRRPTWRGGRATATDVGLGFMSLRSLACLKGPHTAHRMVASRRWQRRRRACHAGDLDHPSPPEGEKRPLWSLREMPLW